VNADAPWHRTAADVDQTPDPFPKPGTKWQPWHRKPQDKKGPISIRRAIARGADGPNQAQKTN
jgi:hypothetical protein